MSMPLPKTLLLTALLALTLRASVPLCAAVAPDAPATWALAPEDRYTGVLRAIPVRVVAPSPTRREGALSAEIALIDAPARAAGASATIARLPIPPASREVDLAELFPVIWTMRAPRVLYAQLFIDNEPRGAPLVIEPLLARARPPENELERRLREAFERSDTTELNRLLALSDSERDALRALPAPPDEVPALLTGVRTYPLVRAVLETNVGDITVRLRPDAAPRSVRRFIDLASGGFYDDVAFHRIVRADERGRRVLVQTGDPTGTGAGAPGQLDDYEPSTLAHAYGTLSMARHPHRPNTNGAQFFITLSDEAGAAFDGRYTAFAEIVDGADALEAIVRTPLGLADPDDASSQRERPLEPVVIRSAQLVDAPPLDPTTPPEQRISPEDQTPVVR
jgi:cyclophilin family peptidyl-prolyl cis-trans isomerase